MNKPDGMFTIERALVDLEDGITILLEEKKTEIQFFYHAMKRQREALTFLGNSEFAHAFFLLEGDACFEQETATYCFQEYACFIPSPLKKFSLKSANGLKLLEIRWKLNDDDQARLAGSPSCFPFLQLYSACKPFPAPFVNSAVACRSLIPDFLFSGFRIGSYESHGFCKIDYRSQTNVNQYLFSFCDSNAILTTKNSQEKFDGITLLHVSPESAFSITIPKERKLHCLWMEFPYFSCKNFSSNILKRESSF